jgi:hypothetical protein
MISGLIDLLVVNSTTNSTLLEATGPEMNQSRLTLKEFLNSIFFGQSPQNLLQDPSVR